MRFSSILTLAALKALALAANPLPDYALTYAPYSYLYTGERTFPSDVTVHLNHTIPEVDRTPVAGFTTAGSVTLDTLNNLASGVYLTSADDIFSQPAWLVSDYGAPENATGYSAAPGLILGVEKNESTVDVFYFYFYSYNWGRPVLDIELDLHVGDWEHNMIRFVNGTPYAIYLSQHSAGSAYYWDILPTAPGTLRPITYIANGSHANYATAGSQEYTIALGLITDVTDAGSAWDMTLNYRGYWYDVASGQFTAAGGAGVGATEEAEEAVTTWLNWEGMWGDEEYELLVDGQYCFFGECLVESGPTGPVMKNLGRTTVCQDEDDCVIFDNINDLTEQSKKREVE